MTRRRSRLEPRFVRWRSLRCLRAAPPRERSEALRASLAKCGSKATGRAKLCRACVRFAHADPVTSFGGSSARSLAYGSFAVQLLTLHHRTATATPSPADSFARSFAQSFLVRVARLWRAPTRHRLQQRTSLGKNRIHPHNSNRLTVVYSGPSSSSTLSVSRTSFTSSVPTVRSVSRSARWTRSLPPAWSILAIVACGVNS